jgi:hypothetical protein
MDTTVGEERERQSHKDSHKDSQKDSQKDSNDGLGPRIEELKEQIVLLNDRAKGFIKEHPAACLMGALGLGYLFARIARRGR